MADHPDEQVRPGLDRRKFLGALGAAAAAGVFLESVGGRAEGASQGTHPPPVLYQDSFGNVGPANPDALAAGIVPPPVPSAASPDAGGGATYVTPGYAQPNFLMIMVDQMGAPRWLPPGGQMAIDGLMPNISGLRKQSCVFPNYFVAATACTPSRATLLTGLYSQQTCMFNTLANWCNPKLLPYGPDPKTGKPTGFPTIGNVLSQPLPQGIGGPLTPGYDTVWIGKWHLSAMGSGKSMCGNAPGDVAPGPAAYGFNDAEYCIPNTSSNLYYNQQLGQQPLAYPSPDGWPNEGCGGALLQPLSGEAAHHGTTFVYQDYGSPYTNQELPMKDPGYIALGDGAIADAFNTWLTNGAPAPPPAGKPWFCAVSFINPHDITSFPYYYGLAGTDQPSGLGVFGSPSLATIGYLPPPTTGYSPVPPHGPDEQIVALTTLYPPSGTPPVGPFNQPWNGIYTDAPSHLPYGPSGGVYGKPTLQLVHQVNASHLVGSIEDQNAWFTFLNYYFWLQANVDAQIGRVLNALNNLPAVAANTIVVFLSDHGDYAGSHWLHDKAFGLYDESINVPLYIKCIGQTKARTLPYACSSVDILPFLYTLALGNDSWRTNPHDLVGYLYKREAISDFIFGASPAQRRLSAIPTSADSSVMQPYVLHTTDEGFVPVKDPSGVVPTVPTHAIAFRTVDYSPGPTLPNGGGKLGMYSSWNYGNPPAGSTQKNPTQPDPAAGPVQFEFYNYSPVSSSQTLPPNYGETGNQVTISGGALTGESLTYQNNFSAADVQNELYSFSMYQGAAVPPYITNAYSKALATYLGYVAAAQAARAPADTTWQT